MFKRFYLIVGTIVVGVLMVSLAAQTFDPETGLPVVEEEPDKGEELEMEDVRTFTEEELRQIIRGEIRKANLVRQTRRLSPGRMDITGMARADARRQHNGIAWGIGGGLLGCGAASLGGMVGAGVAGFPGFLIGTVAGAVGTPALIASASTSAPAIPSELQQAGPEKQASYRQTHIDDTKKLRRNSILKGEVGIALVAGIGLLVFVLSFYF